MGEWDEHRQAVGAEDDRPVVLIALGVDPLEEADHEAEDGGDDGAGEVDLCDGEVAVHAVVEEGEGAAGDEQTDACEVEAQEQAVGFW